MKDVSLNLGHWVKRGGVVIPDELPNCECGFVYLITNTVSGKKYLGKKQMMTHKKYPARKGKVKCRRIWKDTDWRKYVSSSEYIKSDIKENGKDHYTFEILCFCLSKSEMNYIELKLQIMYDALIDPDFLNGIINIRLGKVSQGFDLKRLNDQIGSIVV